MARASVRLTILCALLAYAWLPQQASAVLLSKADELRQRSESDGGLVELSDSDYERFVLKGPRDYHIIVLYTSRRPEHGCHICRVLESELRTVATSYWQRPREQNDLQFAVVDYAAARNAFQRHAFKTIPILAHFGPTASSAVDSLAQDQLFTVQDDSLHAEGVALFVRQKTRIQVDIVRSPVFKLLLLLVLLAVATMGGRLALDHMPALLSLIRSRNIWLVVSIGVYFVSVSGGVFDIIRNPLPFYCTRGGCSFVHPSSSYQFVVEGLIVGGLNMACAAAVVFLSRNAWKLDQANRGMAVGIAVVVFVLLYGQLVGLYRFKSRWYPFRIVF